MQWGFLSKLGFLNSTYSESIIRSLNDDGMVNSFFLGGGGVIKDILSYTNSFQSYSFSHVVRQGNAVAYALAQRARLIIYSFRSLDAIYSTKYLFFCLV